MKDYVRQLIFKANEITPNRRVYTTEALEEAGDNMKDTTPVVLEREDFKKGVVQLNKIAGLAHFLSVEDDNSVHIAFRTIDTPNGKILEGLLDEEQLTNKFDMLCYGVAEENVVKDIKLVGFALTREEKSNDENV